MSTIPFNTTAKTFQPRKATQPPPPSSETKDVSSIKEFVPQNRQTAPVPADTQNDTKIVFKPDAKEFKPKSKSVAPPDPTPALPAADIKAIKPFIPKSKPIPPPEPTPEFPSTVPTPNAIFAPPAATQYRIAPQNPPLFSSPALVTPNQHDDIDLKTIMVEKAKVFVPSAPKNPASATTAVPLQKPKAMQATDELNTNLIEGIPSVSGVSLGPHQTRYQPRHSDQADDSVPDSDSTPFAGLTPTPFESPADIDGAEQEFSLAKVADSFDVLQRKLPLRLKKLGKFPDWFDSPLQENSSTYSYMTLLSFASKNTQRPLEDFHLETLPPPKVTHIKHPGQNNTFSYGSPGPDALGSKSDAQRAFKKKRDKTNYLDAARSLLNKITIYNFQDVIDELFGVLVSREVLSQVVDIVYEKAIQEAKFRVLYANVCLSIKEHEKELGTMWEDETPQDSPVQSPTQNTEPSRAQESVFRHVLVRKCQNEFFNKPHQPLTDAQRATMTTKEINDWEEIHRLDILGNVEFIGILVNLTILAPNVAVQCIKTLLLDSTPEAPIDSNLETLAHFLMKIGFKMQNEAFDRFASLLTFLQPFIDGGKLTSKTKYALIDVMETAEKRGFKRYENANIQTRPPPPPQTQQQNRPQHERRGKDRGPKDKRKGGRDTQDSRDDRNTQFSYNPSQSSAPPEKKMSWKDKLAAKPKAVEEDVMDDTVAYLYSTTDGDTDTFDESVPLPSPSPVPELEDSIDGHLKFVGDLTNQIMSDTARITPKMIGQLNLKGKVGDRMMVCITRRVLSELLSYVLAQWEIRPGEKPEEVPLIMRMKSFLAEYIANRTTAFSECVDCLASFYYEGRIYNSRRKKAGEVTEVMKEGLMNDSFSLAMKKMQENGSAKLSTPLVFTLHEFPPPFAVHLLNNTITNRLFQRLLSLAMQITLTEGLEQQKIRPVDFIPLARVFNLPGDRVMFALENVLNEDKSRAVEVIEQIRVSSFEWVKKQTLMAVGDIELNADEQQEMTGSALLSQMIHTNHTRLNDMHGIISASEHGDDLQMFLDELLKQKAMYVLFTASNPTEEQIIEETTESLALNIQNSFQLDQLEEAFTHHVVAGAVRLFVLMSKQLANDKNSFADRFQNAYRCIEPLFALLLQNRNDPRVAPFCVAQLGIDAVALTNWDRTIQTSWETESHDSYLHFVLDQLTEAFEFTPEETKSILSLTACGSMLRRKMQELRKELRGSAYDDDMD
ncbi:putative translation initiation factor 4G [Blattamonas nauphoetae]|uniref:Translation initiation factor 4G n=1 Tax=Blattamonas nauphoetae TaxID=2049346 RepID=A0ABQ9XDC3_9EUKA|nr:putative translation initiation factor 4G [Blattamonas nauphoetae]